MRDRSVAGIYSTIKERSPQTIPGDLAHTCAVLPTKYVARGSG